MSTIRGVGLPFAAETLMCLSVDLYPAYSRHCDLTLRRSARWRRDAYCVCSVGLWSSRTAVDINRNSALATMILKRHSNHLIKLRRSDRLFSAILLYIRQMR